MPKPSTRSHRTWSTFPLRPDRRTCILIEDLLIPHHSATNGNNSVANSNPSKGKPEDRIYYINRDDLVNAPESMTRTSLSTRFSESPQQSASARVAIVIT